MNPKVFNKCLDELRRGNKNGLGKILIYFTDKVLCVAQSKVKDIDTAYNIADKFFNYLINSANDIPYIDKPEHWVYDKVTTICETYNRKDNIIFNYGETIINQILINVCSKLNDLEMSVFVLYFMFFFSEQDIAEKLNIYILKVKEIILFRLKPLFKQHELFVKKL